MQLLIASIALLAAVVILLTWRLYKLEQEYLKLARLKLLTYYKDVSIFTGNDHE